MNDNVPVYGSVLYEHTGVNMSTPPISHLSSSPTLAAVPLYGLPVHPATERLEPPSRGWECSNSSSPDHRRMNGLCPPPTVHLLSWTASLYDCVDQLCADYFLTVYFVEAAIILACQESSTTTIHHLCATHDGSSGVGSPDVIRRKGPSNSKGSKCAFDQASDTVHKAFSDNTDHSIADVYSVLIAPQNYHSPKRLQSIAISDEHFAALLSPCIYLCLCPRLDEAIRDITDAEVSRCKEQYMVEGVCTISNLLMPQHLSLYTKVQQQFKPLGLWYWSFWSEDIGNSLLLNPTHHNALERRYWQNIEYERRRGGQYAYAFTRTNWASPWYIPLFYPLYNRGAVALLNSAPLKRFFKEITGHDCELFAYFFSNYTSGDL